MGFDELNKKKLGFAKRRLATIKSFLKEQPMQKVNKTVFLQFCDKAFSVGSKSIERDLKHLEDMGFINIETNVTIHYITPKYDAVLDESEKKIKEIVDDVMLKKDMVYKEPEPQPEQQSYEQDNEQGYSE